MFKPENAGIISKKEVSPRGMVALSSTETLERFIEQTPKELLRAVKRESVLHRAFWPRLDEEHETHQKVSAILEQVSLEAGFPEQYFHLVIFKSPFPAAEIHPHTKEIRISENLIAAVSGDAEKLAAILAHEVGHIIMGHFRAKASRGDELQEWDPLNERVQGYEGEYQADRTALIISGRMGIRRDALSEALKDLHRTIENRKNETHSDTVENLDNELSEFNYKAWVTSTHPHLPRRIIAIQRDALWLPKIKKAYVGGKVPILKADDFEETDEELWSSVIPAGYLDSASSSLDCLWENVTVAEGAEENFQAIAPGDILGILDRDRAASKKTKKESAVQMEFVPEDVATWSHENTAELEEWWLQAMGQVDGVDGYQDLADDIAQYDQRSVQLVLAHCRAELAEMDDYLNTLDMSGRSKADNEKVKDAIKNYALKILVSTPEENYSPSMDLVVSLLIKRWFELDETLSTPKGMLQYFQFLENFETERGVPFIYDGGRFFLKIEEVFNILSDDAQKERLAKLVLEHEDVLFVSLTKRYKIARQLMPNFYAWIGAKYGEATMKEPKRYVSRKLSVYQLPDAVKDAPKKAHEISREEARAALGTITSDFRMKNATAVMLGIAFQYDKKVDEEGYSDAYLESNPHASAGILSSDEFDEKYFGKGRADYVKAPYGETDHYIQEYIDVFKLWQLAGYEGEFRALASGKNKLDFLLNSFPACCGRRDKYISEALGWKELEFVEDVVGAQADVAAVADVETLFGLEGRFFSPILNLAVSQRLWQLCQQNRDAFKLAVPQSNIEDIHRRIVDFPASARSEEMKLILACFNSPSYFRDDLLRQIVDAAPDRESTMALSSLYCDPPVASFSAHEAETISMSESLLDVADSMLVLDKQELLLYFMGSRCFYSSIDNKYFGMGDDEEVIEMRRHAIFKGKKSFLKKYKDALDNFDEDHEADEERGPRSLVDDPDSLMFLRKASGMPVEVLLKQQKLYTTKREQRNLISRLIAGDRGVLSTDKVQFLKMVAKNIVDGSEWSKGESVEQKKNTASLLNFALNNCPERKLPDMFLGLWNMQQEHQELPEVIAGLLRELGPIFIKTGQYLGTQSTALPPEWIKAFRGLADQNLRAEKTMVYEHEMYEYGKDSPFLRIGAKQGEGSMASVYEATRKDGTRSAVKVIHPCIEDELSDDIQFLDALVGYLNDHKDIFGITLPENLADVIEGQVIKELSFESIVTNNEAMQQVLGKSRSDIAWRVPNIQRETSRPDFIDFSFSEGKPLDTLEGESRQKVYSEIGLELMRQILFEGTFQGDPNIGNFKVHSGGKKLAVDWLDTDHLGRLDKVEIKKLRSLVKELALSKRPAKVAEVLTSFIAIPSPAEVVPDLEKWIVDSQLLAKGDSSDMEKILTSFLDLLADKGLRLQDQYVTLIRSLGLMKPFLEQISAGQGAKFLAKLVISG